MTGGEGDCIPWRQEALERVAQSRAGKGAGSEGK